MAKAQHSLGSLFTGILAPLADAVEAETGRRLTLPGWGRVARSVAAAGLRLLADAIQPQAVEPDAAPVELPTVELPTVEPVAPVYAVPDLATAEPARIAEVKPAKRPRNRIGKAAANGKARAMASANRTTAPKGKPAKRKPAAEGKLAAPAKRKPAAPVAKAGKKSGKSV